MKKYRIISAVLAGVTALFMTGCMRMAIDVELKKDGTPQYGVIRLYYENGQINIIDDAGISGIDYTNIVFSFL